MKFYFEEKKRKKTPHCHNCDTAFDETDNFCRRCGQENHDLKVPIPHILEEVFEGFTHFDNKFFTTIKSIFSKPGLITKDFLDGKRTRFVAPLRLFFFISATYFFLYSCSQTKGLEVSNDPTWVKEEVDKFTVEDLLNRLEVKSWDSIRLILPKKTLIGQKRILMSLYQNALKDTLNTYPLKVGNVTRVYIKKTLKECQLPVPDTILFRAIVLNRKVKIPLDTAQSYWVVGNGTTKKVVFEWLSYNDKEIDSVYVASEHQQINWWERIAFKLLRKNQYNKQLAKEKDENYERVINTKTISYTFFILIPLVGFLLWLFFKKVRPFYYEHLIASIYLHCMVYLIFSIPHLMYLIFNINLDEVFGESAFLILLVGFWLYFLISVKYIFQQTWFRTVLKSVIFGICYAMLFFICYTPISVWLISQFVKH
jgi:Protein of unknown function (DUF3667)